MAQFFNGTRYVVITGTEYTDHSVWVVSGMSAKLIGTLRKTIFNRTVKTANDIDVVAAPKSFEHVEDDVAGVLLTGVKSHATFSGVYSYA